jgi:hypothetical protein
MYPLLDNRTVSAHSEELRRTAAAARLALTARGGAVEDDGVRAHGVRRALGVRLVRAGLRLIEA